MTYPVKVSACACDETYLAKASVYVGHTVCVDGHRTDIKPTCIVKSYFQLLLEAFNMFH